jgi:hypothetical protein
LVAAEAAMEAEWEKEKWVKVAAKIKELDGPDWDPRFMKKTWSDRQEVGA